MSSKFRWPTDAISSAARFPTPTVSTRARLHRLGSPETAISYSSGFAGRGPPRGRRYIGDRRGGLFLKLQGRTPARGGPAEIRRD